MRRILYVITRAERGGAQSHVLDLLRSANSRFEVALATGEEGFLADQARKLGIRVFVLSNLVVPMNPVKDLRGLIGLMKVIREFQPELLHLHSSKAGMLGRVAAQFLRVPCVFTAHGWAFSEGVPRKRRVLAVTLEWLAGHLNATIIAVSRYDQALARCYRVGNPKQTWTIPNGIIDCAERARPSEGDPPVIVMVARFAAPKDHTVLLRALSKVKVPFRLWLAGDGPLLNRAREFAQQVGLEGKTSFLGTREDISELLSQAHIFALLSRHEGLPISILEAMRAGLPIVASNVGGIPETVLDGWNGLLVGRNDDETLRESLELLLSNAELRKRMGRHSRSRFEEAFRVETMVRTTFSCYDHIMAVPALPHTMPAGV